MAKKQKVELTPEEKAAKKLRHSNGWVRFWAIVVALALTAGIYGLASVTAGKETAATGTTAASAHQQAHQALRRLIIGFFIELFIGRFRFFFFERRVGFCR